MKRLLLIALLACATASQAVTQAAAQAAPQKVLRYAFNIAETGFDPVMLTDDYSRTITAHIFESLYGYDPLAMPPRIVPLTATALPEASADFKTFRIRIRPGIYFTDDPAFKGPNGQTRRELTAADYVYTFKRPADPALNSPQWSTIEEMGLLGLAELRAQARKTKTPFNYDQPIDGLRALDRYTLEIRVAEARPRMIESLASSDIVGAVAREVVEAYGSELASHPVGTGPFVLKAWRRSSLIVLARNPAYRERFFESTPAADDAEGLAIAARLRGRRLPMIDRVEVAIIEESQPRWLSYLSGEQDLIYRVPPEFVNLAMPLGKLAPNLAKRGMQLFRSLTADAAMTYFNMDDPTIGGYTADKVALRRAVSLAWDTPREVRLLRRGQAIVAQSLAVPHTSGYDPAFKSEMGDFDPARANALLDLYGYVDRDNDGWRDMPDGSPLVLDWATQPDSLSRSYDEMFKINMGRVHLRVKFSTAKWPEQLKAAQAGKLMMWFVGSTANQPDGITALQRLYSPQAGQENLGRFKSAEFDAIYERLQAMPDGPEREALFLQAKRIQVAQMPLKTHVHRIVSDIAQPWVVGFRRPMFRYEFWQFIDVDTAKLPAVH